jgi:aspartate aminotransferase-like enzyme
MRCVPKYNLVPGPTTVSASVLQAFLENLGSSDLEENDDFWNDYQGLQRALQQILHTSNDIVIMSGEGMVVLWGALKSVLQPGDKVVAVVNGLYGAGFADMATGLGATVTRVEFGWDSGVVDNDKVIETIKQIKPKLVTMVHCETPTGCLNNLTGIGPATTEYGGLFLVDFVSSAGGVKLHVDDEHIDLGLLASQKVLGAPPALAFASISPRAWTVIEAVQYAGYDALLPFQGMGRAGNKLLPYTHNWHAIAGTRIACQELLTEGLEKVQERHLAARDACIAHAMEMGLQLYNSDCPSPTVTAFYVPDDIEWSKLNASLRAKGMIVAGSYGDLRGKIFRIGHMGNQANKEMVNDAMGILEQTIKELRIECRRGASDIR